MSHKLFSFLFILFSLPCIAQLSMEDFLREALNDPSVKSISEQKDHINPKNFRLAPIQKLEFRTESNQLDPERQDFAIRLNPANPWEVKRNNQYFETYKEVLTIDQSRVIKEALLKRYEVIIDWVHYSEIQQLREEEKSITDKLIAILEGQRFSNYFNANDYVDTKLLQIEKAIELEEARFERDLQYKKIESFTPQSTFKDIDWSYSSLIGLDKLESVADSLSILKVNGGEVAYRERQIDLATRELQLEKSNINVGFLQTQYQQYRIDQGRKPWSISLGVTIPVFNPNKGDITKRKLDLIEAQGRFDETKIEHLAARDFSLKKLKNVLARHREIYTMMEELKSGTLTSTLQQMKDSNPVVILKLQSKMVKLKSMAARLEQEIYGAYLEVLSYAEVLQQQPFVNYLSPNLQFFAR